MTDIPEPLANGRYTLSNTLGEGGMATVYGGFDTMLEVDRAVKVLSPALCRSEKLRKRFLAEARAMAKLRHTNIVTVFDVGVEGETPFIVMEMVKGGSLIDLMDQSGPQPVSIAGPIMLGALAGLQASHDRGVIHRDIKPHNMLMTLDGVVKITDFGIANMQEDERSFTKTGAVMGTLAYMPPEQRQNAKGLGPTADVFAAGASLFALLTGQEPFDLYNESLHEKLFAGLPKRISAVVIKACAYDPADRYQSASSMSVDLQRVLREMDIPIAPDNRVSIGAKSDGTIFFDSEQALAQAVVPSPVSRVENTTIHPNETFYASDNPVQAVTTARRKIPLPTKLKWASIAIRLAIVLSVGWVVYSVGLSPDQSTVDDVSIVQKQMPPELKETAAELKSARDAAEAEVADTTPAATVQPAEPTETVEPADEIVRDTPKISPPAKRSDAGQAAATAAPAPATAKVVSQPKPVVQTPPPTGPAMLGVWSIPPGLYSIDGRDQGKMKLGRREVTPGTHTLILRTAERDGPVRTKEIKVSIAAGQKQAVCWNFNTNSNCP